VAAAPKGESNVPQSNIGNVKVNSGNVKAVSDSMQGIAGGVLVLSKISKKDVDSAI